MRLGVSNTNQRSTTFAEPNCRSAGRRDGGKADDGVAVPARPDRGASRAPARIAIPIATEFRCRRPPPIWSSAARRRSAMPRATTSTCAMSPRMRAPCSTSVAEGTIVDVLDGPFTDDTDGTIWYQINASGQPGYMLADYLVNADGAVSPGGGGDHDRQCESSLRGRHQLCRAARDSERRHRQHDRRGAERLHPAHLQRHHRLVGQPVHLDHRRDPTPRPWWTAPLNLRSGPSTSSSGARASCRPAPP